MNKSSTLPYEILLHIFCNLRSLKDIAVCRLVCKNWSISAEERFYNQVRSPDVSSAASFINTMPNSSHRSGRFVKDLTVYGLFESNKIDWKTCPIFANLVHLCPNVEELHLMSIKSDSFYQALIQARESGHWKNLKAIPAPTDEMQLERYVDTILDTVILLHI